MADVNLQVLLRRFSLQTFANMKWKEYIGSITLSTARILGSLCRTRQFFLSESVSHIIFVICYLLIGRK